MSNLIKRHNHFVPEMYLKNWSKRKKINTYRLLVSDKKVPIWTEQSIKNAASIDNLYVRQEQGKELDDFEEEFMRRYETPATKPLMKACNDQKLTDYDWYALIEFLAAQTVRTPSFYFRSTYENKNMITEYLEEVGKKLSELTPEEINEHPKEITQDENLLPLRVNFTGKIDDDNNEIVEITAIAGKSTWLFSMKYLLSGISSILHQHKWGIATAHSGIIWPTSDDPVICLNYYGEDSYDFKGGWGKQGCEIIMPICPTKALYTRIGADLPEFMVFTKEHSLLVKKLIVEHALMYIYSSEKDSKIPLLRPRKVDLEEYNRIQGELKEWYEQYQEGEVPFLENRLFRRGELIQ